MEIKEIRKKKIEELEKLEEELREKIAKEYLDVRTGKETNVKSPRGLRRDLARVLTVLKEKNNLSRKENGKDAPKGQSKKK